MKKNMIITIGRQYGSGGREIGKKLAEKLGYAYYDTEILEHAAKSSGLSKEILSRYDECLTDNWLNLSVGMNGGADTSKLPVPMRAEIAQFEAIREIGKKGSAVIVGRCADYVLREQDNVFSVFIYARMEQRISRVAKRNGISVEEAKKRIKNTDKKRMAYYNYYTDKSWGKNGNYHLCLDSGFLGIDHAVEMLEACINVMS